MTFESERATRLQMLEGIGYMKQIQALARSLTAPFWWHGLDEAGRYRILHNGSVCFVHTGKRTVAVSAHHVYQKYLQDKALFETFGCQFGSSTIEPEKYVIDWSEELDIVSFAVPEILLAATGSSVHYPMRWPTDQLKQGDVVMCGGYPGLLREERQTKAEWPFISLATRVLSATPENITLHVDLPTILWGSDVRDNERRIANFGGLSGGPIYRSKDSPVDHLELAGFIYESSVKAPTREEPKPIGLILGRHAWRLDLDGRIRS